MGPKIKSNSSKRKAVRRTIEVKKEIISKFEGGTRVTDLATHYGMAKSTISSILKNKNVLKEANVAKGVTVLAVNRPPVIEQVEKLLLVWINEKQLAGDSISEAIICEKAKRLHDDLKHDTPGTSGTKSDEFKASRRWFDRFKKRSGIHSVVRHGEAASSNKDAAEKFVGEFKIFVENEAFSPNQVFNCDEKSMGLDVDSDDVEELIEDHRNELTTEELQELQREQQEIIDDVSSEEEESISTKEIKELCHHWENIEHIVQKWHPNTAVANRSVNLFNDNVMEHFRRILKKRQKQSTLDIFFE